MKKIGLLLSLLWCAVPAFSQVGINGAYRLHHAPKWIHEGSTASVSPVGSGFAIGIDYWWRLKKYRLEFLPELNVGRYRQHNDFDQQFSNSLYSLFLNTNWYIFDFEGDCNCPTFSKQGEFLKKGFFVQISPGLSYMQYELSYNEEIAPDKPVELNSEELAFSLGLGAGLDIGVTDLITVTPLLGLRYYPVMNWPGLSQLPPVNDAVLEEKSPLWQLSAGARVGLRFDYGNRRRRW